jgi:hypothetical protein
MNTQTSNPVIDELAALISTWLMDAAFLNGRQGSTQDTGFGGLTAPPTAAGAMLSRSRHTRLAVHQS